MGSDDNDTPLNQRRKKSTDEDEGEKKEEAEESDEDKPLGQRRKKSTDDQEEGKRDDCGNCRSCRDKPKFGGRGVLKQACQQRACQSMEVRERKEKSGRTRPRREKKADKD